MMRFHKKYDWVKISGILIVLVIDVLIVIGIITLCSCRCIKINQIEYEKAKE